MNENSSRETRELQNGLEPFCNGYAAYNVILEGQRELTQYAVEINDLRVNVKLFEPEVNKEQELVQIYGEAQIECDFIEEEGAYQTEQFTKQFTKLLVLTEPDFDLDIDCTVEVESLKYHLVDWELAYWLKLLLYVTENDSTVVEEEEEENEEGEYKQPQVYEDQPNNEDHVNDEGTEDNQKSSENQNWEKFREEQKLYMKVYVVQKGDTLNDIAQKFGLSVNNIKKANNLSDSDTINSNSKLLIPID